MIQVIALNEQSDVDRPEQVSDTLPRVPTDASHIKVVAHFEYWRRIGRLLSQSILNTERHSSLPASLFLSLLPSVVFLASFVAALFREVVYQLTGLRSF
jgi:hypothetical protein